MENSALTVVFSIFLLLTCRDIFFGHSSHDTAKHDTSNINPASPSAFLAADHQHLHVQPGAARYSRMPGHHEGPAVSSLKIQYCHSCGYRQAFDEISKMVQRTFPELLVEGSLHQPGWLRSQLVNLIFIVKIAIMGMIYMDYNPFVRLQMDTPRIWIYMTQNKITSILMIFFIANSIEGNMMSTGAFEIYLNDMPVWSKIQTGRMPAGHELMNIISSHLSLGKDKIGAGLSH